MEEKILVLGVGKPYDFTSDDGNRISGCKMHYLPTDTLTASAEANADGTIGIIPLVETMPVEFFNRAHNQALPCKAKVTYVMRSQGGKRVLKMEGLDFVSK